MSSWKWFLLSLFGGGIAFWIPDVVIPAFDRNEQGYAVTAACPIVLILFYVAALRLRKGEPSGPSTAVFAIFLSGTSPLRGALQQFHGVRPSYAPFTFAHCKQRSRRFEIIEPHTY